jgi:hypothetical protein
LLVYIHNVYMFFMNGVIGLVIKYLMN